MAELSFRVYAILTARLRSMTHCCGRFSGLHMLAFTLMMPVAQAQLSFTNVTDTKLVGGISSETWGASIGDINGDYWPDIFVSNHRNRPSIYQYNSDGTFSNNILQIDQGDAWLGERYIDTHGAAWSDFDGDGDDDLMVTTNAARYHFFLQSADNAFLPNQAQTRLGIDTSSNYSTWYDLNKDGLADLFQGRDAENLSLFFQQDSTGGNFTATPPRFVPGCDGDWAVFTDLNDDEIADYLCALEGYFPLEAYDLSDTSLSTSLKSSLPVVSYVVDNAAVDINNDLRPDLVMVRGAISSSSATQHGPNLIELSADTGNGEEVIFSFTGGGELTVNAWSPPTNVATTVIADSAIVAGFNFQFNAANNQWTVSRSTARWEFAYLQIRSDTPMRDLTPVQVSLRDVPLLPMVLQRENGGWIDRTQESGLNELMECVSMVAADFDNDMDQDLYFVCGRATENLSNRLFSNDGNGNFSEVPNAGGAGAITGAPFADGIATGENVVTGDLNNNGFIDLFVLNGGNSQPVRSRLGPHELILNDGNTNNWIELELIGTASDADATGTRIVATAGGVSQLRESGANYHRWSQNHNRIHFGLGTNTTVDLSIKWPSGSMENFAGVDANRLYAVTEGAGIEAIMLAPPQPPAQESAEPGQECGTPEYFSDMDTGIFLYKDCVSDKWNVRFTAALQTEMTYTGQIATDETLVLGAFYRKESGDTVTRSLPGTIDFSMTTVNGDEDGFALTIPSDPNVKTCFDVTAPAKPRVFLGSKHIPIALPFDLATLRSCNANRAPQITVPGTQVSLYNTPVDLLITAFDAENDALTFSATGLPVGLEMDAASGVISGTVTIAGDYEPQITVSDAAGNSDTASFIWLVSDGSNVSPVIVNPGDQQNTSSTIINLNIAATDFENDPLSYSAINLPTGLVIDSTTGSITGTLALPGSYTPEITVVDNQGGESLISFNWIVISSADILCGSPDYDAETEEGTFLWRDCASGTYFLHVSDGGASERIVYQGLIDSSEPFSSVIPISYEPQWEDFIDTSVNNRIDYLFNVQLGAYDGLSFVVSSSAKTCVGLGAAVGSTILLGEQRKAYTLPVDLVTLQACDSDGDNVPPTVTPVSDQLSVEGESVSLQLTAEDANFDTLEFSSTTLPPGLSISSSGLVAGTVAPNSAGIYDVRVDVDDGKVVVETAFIWTILSEPDPACGEPDYDSNTEEGTFLWRNCTTGIYFLLVSDGGATDRMTFQASIDSSEPFTSVVPFDYEPQWGDYIDVTASDRIDYTLHVRRGMFDGLSFAVEPGAQTCVGFGAAAGSVVFVGAQKNALTLPLDPVSLQSCSSVGTNISPSITPIDNQLAFEGNAVSIQISATDKNFDSLEFSSTTLPPGLSISSTGLIAGTVASNSVGFYDVRIAVDDGDAVVETEFVWTILSEPGPACGEPDYDTNAEAGSFLWQDCTTGTYYLHVSDGGAPDRITFEGRIDSNRAFASVTTIDYEPQWEDFIDATVDGRIDYTLHVRRGTFDGLSFSLEPGAQACVGLGSASGSTVFVGQQKTAVTLPVNVLTFDSCSTNVTPEIEPVEDQVHSEGESVIVQISASDGNNDPLSFAARNLPLGLSISPDGVISGAIALGSIGQYEVSVDVDDGWDVSTIQFGWTVNN